MKAEPKTSDPEELDESAPAPVPPPRRRWGGMIERKERWGLTWRARAILLFSALLLALIFGLAIRPFLAVTARVPGNILVFEGWCHAFSAHQALLEMGANGYDYIYCTGGPVDGSGPYSGDQNTTAAVGAQELARAGMPVSRIRIAAARDFGRDRTYNSALALRAWLQAHGVSVTGVNIITEGAHARRSRLLFRRAFGPGTPVGVIAEQTPDFKPRTWWKTSEGVREVIGETIAYVYVRLFFHPPENP